MKMRLGIHAIVLASLAAAPAVASAQTRESTSWGLLGGVNLSSITNSGDSQNRVGYDVGAFLQQPLAGVWSFRGEAHYTTKGVKASESGTEVSFNLGYLEFPLLLRATAASSSGVNPFFEVGPALAVRLDCSASASGGGVSVNVSCSELGTDLRSFDVGVLGGLGVEFPVGRNAVSVGARYNLGLIDLSKVDASANRNLQFLIGIRFK